MIPMLPNSPEEVVSNIGYHAKFTASTAPMQFDTAQVTSPLLSSYQ